MHLLSVIICTHNPRGDYFGRVLAGLKAQSLSPENWEFVLIDNCSEEAVADRIEMSWHANVRIVREEKLGLTSARLRGIREALGDLLVFVDDDNVLDPDYLEVALRIARERPFLGSWSGQSRPWFEKPPPAWTRHYWGNLVIREFDRDVWSNLPRLAETMPCGAGLVVRRETARYYLDLHDRGARDQFQLDRTGGSLLSGGDNDLAACACDIGLGVGLMKDLKLTHLIAPERLTQDYLTRLAEGISYSSTLLDAARGLHRAPKPLVGRVIDLLRLMRLSEPHRSIAAAFNRGRNRAARDLASG